MDDASKDGEGRIVQEGVLSSSRNERLCAYMRGWDRKIGGGAQDVSLLGAL